MYYAPFLPLLKSQLIFSENFALVLSILNFRPEISQSSPLFKEFFAYFFRTNTESVNRSLYLCTLHLLKFTTRLSFSIYELLRHRNVFFTSSVLLPLSWMSFTIIPSNPHVHVFKPPSYQLKETFKSPSRISKLRLVKVMSHGTIRNGDF